MSKHIDYNKYGYILYVQWRARKKKSKVMIKFKLNMRMSYSSEGQHIMIDDKLRREKQPSIVFIPS